MRAKTLVMAAAIAAAAVVPTAVPAQAASWPADCLSSTGVPQLQSIVTDSEGVHVYPDLLDEDIDMLAAWALDKAGIALCLEHGIVTNFAFCQANKVPGIVGSLDPLNGDLRYVAYDGAIHVRYPLLLDDLKGCELLPPE